MTHASLAFSRALSQESVSCGPPADARLARLCQVPHRSSPRMLLADGRSGSVRPMLPCRWQDRVPRSRSGRPAGGFRPGHHVADRRRIVGIPATRSNDCTAFYVARCLRSLDVDKYQCRMKSIKIDRFQPALIDVYNDNRTWRVTGSRTPPCEEACGKDLARLLRAHAKPNSRKRPQEVAQENEHRGLCRAATRQSLRHSETSIPLSTPNGGSS